MGLKKRTHNDDVHEALKYVATDIGRKLRIIRKHTPKHWSKRMFDNWIRLPILVRDKIGQRGTTPWILLCGNDADLEVLVNYCKDVFYEYLEGVE